MSADTKKSPLLLYFTILLFISIEDKSAASFCCHIAACVPDIFCNFYFVKNHKIANNLTTFNASEKISTYLYSLELKKIDVCLIKFKNNKFLFN